MCSETERVQPELPPELTDRIIDFLYNEPRALAACSLVAKSWTGASRCHQFAWARLVSDEDWAKLDQLIETSPSTIHYIRRITIDVTDERPTSFFSACTRFPLLEHITMNGVITPPWELEAAAISSVAHKITSLALGHNASFPSRDGFWPIVRMFPNLRCFHPLEVRYVVSSEPLQLSSWSCYSPPISFVSVAAGHERVLDDLCNPPYPLASLSRLSIHPTDVDKAGGLQAFVKTYANQITRLRLYVLRTSRLYSPDYISCFTSIRRLTFASLNLVQYERPRRKGEERPFAWVNGTLSSVQSPITYLAFEILIHRASDLNVVDRTAIDVLISKGGTLRSLIQVSVVFSDRLEGGDRDPNSVAHPVAIRRLMPLTATMGLLTVATRGPELHPSR